MATLLQFSVGNFRSFKEKRILSMQPSSVKDEPVESVCIKGHNKYLSSVAIYGANSSGKSNLVLALGMMKQLVISSVKLNDHDSLPYEPFVLTQETRVEPTFFEVIYLDDDLSKVRYGVEYDSEKIYKEWLFLTEQSKKEVPYFLRDTEGIGINEECFKEGAGLEEKTNDNRLFVSLVAQLGGKISKGIINFFHQGYNVISGINNVGYHGVTEQLFLGKREEAKDALQFFKDIKLGFNDLIAKEREVENDSKVVDLFTIHNVYDKKGNIVDTQPMAFRYHESQGSQKLFEMSGPIFESLKYGRILVIDELDAKMHPLISQKIIELFNSRDSNLHGAQLIFTTHNTNLLSSHLLRRDQVWFTEKDNIESTDLYSIMHVVLPDGSRPRGDGNLERNYIKGRYGAIPYFSDMD